MFNKLKYPARGDLPIREVEFVEGTGAAHLLEVAAPPRSAARTPATAETGTAVPRVDRALMPARTRTAAAAPRSRPRAVRRAVSVSQAEYLAD